MFLEIFTVLVLFLLVWYRLKYGHRNQLLAKVPAPKRWPLIHHVPEFIGKTPRQLFIFFEEIKNKFGQVYVLTFEPFDDGSYVISDPKVAEAILTSLKHLKKSNDYDMMKNWLGDGLLLSIGNKWKQRRKVLTPAFHFQILEKFVEVMESHGNVLIEKLEKLEGKEVDIHPLLNLYALDVICGM
jgi:cytochrome P450